MNLKDLPDMSAAYQEVQEKAKKLDPVGKEDGDVDNDGDKDSSDKYLMKRRKAISKAMKEHHQKDENGKVIEHDEEEVEEAYTVTNADKKGNTKAYQNFKAGMKGKDGKPLYKAADHMKEEEIHPDDNALSPEELEKVAQLSREWDERMKEEALPEGSSYGITKGSGTPSGPMAGFAKAPRKQKGAMAYDGPNKAASEAKDRILAKTKAKREKMKMEHHQKDANGNTIPHEDELNEADKKGKGSGTKDACYKKVKASAKVWPSAYASGRLVQCRKKGAANYGNKSEEAIWEEIGSLLEELGFEGDIDITLSDSNEIVEEIEFQECWKTHKKVGMKMKGGKLVNDCRPKNEEVEQIDEISADLALKASKKAEVERGKAAVAGNKERAIEKMKQSSRLYAKQAKKRRMETK